MLWVGYSVVAGALVLGLLLVLRTGVFRFRPPLAMVLPGQTGGTAMAGVVQQKRLRGHVGLALLLHAIVIGSGFVGLRGCAAEKHERPLGIPGGSGVTIAQGKPTTNFKKVLQAAQKQMKAEATRHHIKRESLLQMIRAQKEQEEATQHAAAAGALDDVGLPQGVGHGSTAAGSPFGTRIGGKLWLYRIRYDGGDWNANPASLPTLLKEVKAALGVEVSSKQEAIRMGELPEHRGAFMPSMLFMTGTGGIESSVEERKGLREYLINGGMLVADSSGGDFEGQFANFMAEVLPEYHLRTLELDHEVYRGGDMPYQMPRGCPIYREHGSEAARGIVDPKTDRLMVFLSPGDLGDAWASPAEGGKRGAVELAFQMGTNLVTYSLMTVHDLREKEKPAKEVVK